MYELDCGGKGAEAARLVFDWYNALSRGERLSAHLDAYDPQLRISLLEAGVRHRAIRSVDGTWELLIQRELSPAQGTIPGVHHAVSDGKESVWVCERAARVSRIDGHERRVVATAEVATAAAHLALDAEGDVLYVADAGAGEVLALRAADLKLKDRWAAPGAPQLPLASPDGVVCVTGGASGTLTIARPRAGGYDVKTIPVGRNPHETALTRDAGHVFVSCTGDGVLVKVRLDDGSIVGRCATGDGPTHLRPIGRHVYVTNSWDGTVSCLTEDGTVVARAASGGWAHALDATPDGRWLYVANFLDDTLAVFDVESLKRVALLETEAYAHGVDISPDGRYVVAGGFSSDFARVYDAAAHLELGRIEIGRGSSHSAFVANTAFVCCSVADHVACVDLDARRETGRLRLGR
jgi:DNA-binding beta-propeller fold protein YncE